MGGAGAGGGRGVSASLGIDLGTSGIKVLLRGPGEEILGRAEAPLAVAVPAVGASEQDPRAWTEALGQALDSLAATHREVLGRVGAIGCSGQMLGVVLLDGADDPVRPALLWNDQRAVRECGELEARVPTIGRRTNGRPDPGFPAAKLLWLRRHEPTVLDRARWLLLPKDYLVLFLTGERATDPSDAGGTQFLDNATGRWDPELIAAAGWRREALPEIHPSAGTVGGLRAECARRWGLPAGVPVVAGAGDNSAATLGVGAARPGEGVLTLGTSAVSCLVDGDFHPGPDEAVLTVPHAVPGTWLSMGVVMNGTSALNWLSGITGERAPRLAEAAAACWEEGRALSAPLFLPALSGIRTPDHDPRATGRMSGLRTSTGTAELAYATLEGVVLQMAEAVRAQERVGVAVERLSAVGGGSRSRFWVRLLASALGQPLDLPARAALAAPLGAARLASIAGGAEPGEALGAPVAREEHVEPEVGLASFLRERREAWAELR